MAYPVVLLVIREVCLAEVLVLEEVGIAHPLRPRQEPLQVQEPWEGLAPAWARVEPVVSAHLRAAQITTQAEQASTVLAAARDRRAARLAAHSAEEH